MFAGSSLYRSFLWCWYYGILNVICVGNLCFKCTLQIKKFLMVSWRVLLKWLLCLVASDQTLHFLFPIFSLSTTLIAVIQAFD